MNSAFDPDARRAELADAVGRVLLRDGIGAVSMRTVAAEAGVAVGSLRYVFPTRADLVVGAARRMVTESRARILALRPPGETGEPTPGELRAFAGEIARALLPLTPRTRADLEINIALVAESRAVPALRAVRDEVQAEVRSAAEAIVRLLRTCPPVADPLTAAQHRHAVRLHALVDGLALALLHHDEAPTPAQREREAEALAVLDAELDAVAADLAVSGDGAA